jgi:hypothetical protein
MAKIAAILDGKIFLLNLMEDLEVLIDWLDHLQYFSKQDLIQAANKDTMALPNISKSSAKRR